MTGTIQLDCQYTKENILEVQTPLHRKGAKIYTGLALIGAVMLGVGIYFTMFSLIYFGTFWLVFFLVGRNHRARKIAKQTVKSNQTNYGEPVRTTTKFYNTLLVAKNHQSGSELRTPYEDVSRIVRTKNLLALVLPDNICVMGDRRPLDPETDKELWEHLLEQCHNAEIQTV